MGIQIPDPCTESWAQMTPTDQGAFCQKCAKEVIDFSRKSPSEIKSILTEKFSSGASVCGRIKKSQMKALEGVDFTFKTERESFQVVWAFSLIAVFGLTLFSCQNTFTKETVEQMHQETQQILADSKGNRSSSDSGDIETENKNPVLAIDSLPSNYPFVHFPQEETYWMGTVPYYNPKELEFFIGHEWSLDFTMYEAMLAMPPENPLENQKEAFIDLPIFSPFSSFIAKRNWNNTPQNPAPLKPQPRADLIFNENLDDFIAYIGPVPISTESRLFVEAFREIELNVEIYHADSESIVLANQLTLKKANYALDIHLTDLKPGKHQVHLESKTTLQTIDFQIDSQNLA